MVSAEDIRYFSWSYFFAVVILSAGVIFPLVVMIRKGWASLFKRGVAE